MLSVDDCFLAANDIKARSYGDGVLDTSALQIVDIGIGEIFFSVRDAISSRIQGLYVFEVSKDHIHLIVPDACLGHVKIGIVVGKRAALCYWWLYGMAINVVELSAFTKSFFA